MSERLTGQVAIVTGGSRGIGRAIVEALSREGAFVMIASPDEERGQATADELSEQGGRAAFIQTDATQKEQVQSLVTRTLADHKRIDVLVNNAGVHAGSAFWEESQETWERMYRVNVLGSALPSQAVVRYMKDHGGGTIVNVASKAGVVGEPGHAAYSASKGAVIAMTRAMAIELAPFKIRVNAVCPGPVLTDMMLEAVPDQVRRDEIASETPLGRVGKPEDIAEAVVYLASSDSGWCTGQALSIDGGLSVLK